MPNDINKPTTDHLSEAFRAKLENHQMPVDAGMWEAIESKLAPQTKSKKRISPIWWSSTAIAAAVALLFVFNIPSVVDQPLPVAQQVLTPVQKVQNAAPQLNKSTAYVQNTVEPNEQLSNNIPAPQASKTNFSSNNTKPTTLVSKPATSPARVDGDVKTASNTNFDIVSEKQQAASIDHLASNEKPTVNQLSTDTVADKILIAEQLEQTNKSENTPKLELKSDDWTDPLAKNKAGRGWELLAMAGSSGNTGTGMDANVFSDLSDVYYFNYVNPELDLSESKLSQNYVLPLDSYNEQNHFAPITAGAAISFGLTDRLSIETGLNYSYLLSTYENTSNNSDARSNLHYLGIPLRLSFRYAQANKWQFYVSGGATLEKGLWQLLVQNQRYTNQVYTTRVKDNIDGVQWSLQASTGVGYRLFKNTSLYFEPKVAWYFDNNQPTSIRTESQLSIGFEAGLRFRIK